MSHASDMPDGEVRMIDVELELIPRQPTSMAPLEVVVTPGTGADVDDAPLALLGVPSRGLAWSTPVYLAMPAPFVTDPANSQV